MKYREDIKAVVNFFSYEDGFEDVKPYHCQGLTSALGLILSDAKKDACYLVYFEGVYLVIDDIDIICKFCEMCYNHFDIDDDDESFVISLYQHETLREAYNHLLEIADYNE
jgi:hypothetical protein